MIANTRKTNNYCRYAGTDGKLASFFSSFFSSFSYSSPVPERILQIPLTITFSGATGRDRCDSLPSRARTTSEGQPTVVTSSHPRATHIISHVPVSRPHSMCGRGLSPPIASMPISPASDVCSSDSAGSSPSMDDCGESIMEEGTVLRYGHSLTPDEPPVILDKKADDYALWSTSHPHLKYSLNFKSHSPSQVNNNTEKIYGS